MNNNCPFCGGALDANGVCANLDTCTSMKPGFETGPFYRDNESRCGLCGEDSNGAPFCFGCWDTAGEGGLIPHYGEHS